MEILKHELSLDLNGTPFGDGVSDIRKTALEHQKDRFFLEERDDVTRQRILFVKILDEHFETLFNGSNQERSVHWEEIRQLMIEQGAVTLVDKDWKYVAGCYWQNIRKESIRRMAKLRTGAMKQARADQMELDRLVSEVVNKRGPGSLESVIRNYGRIWNDEESPSSSSQIQPNCRPPHQQQQGQSTSTATAEVIVPIVLPIHVPTEEQLSNSASPAAGVAAHEEHVQSSSHALAQFIRNSASTFRPDLPSHQQQSKISPVSAHPQQKHSADSECGSAQLGRLVSRTHFQLLSGGYADMAADFEQQLKQTVANYKAWMFDQLFKADGEELDDEMGLGPGTEKRPKLA